MNPVSVIDFQPQHQPWFEKFNRDWIEKYFVMEPLDEYVLTQPVKAIIEPGGAVLMAVYDGAIAGTVGLRKLGDDVYEFTKMAVDESFRRKGIAEALCHASFIKAKELGAKEVILFSNSQLKPAIQLYEKMGFRHSPIGIGEYKRSDVKMHIDLDQAVAAAENYFNLLHKI